MPGDSPGVDPTGGPQTNGEPPTTLRYRVPAGRAVGEELVVKNSVFIGTAGHAPDASSAMAFVAEVRDEYPDASHHAWAYRITAGPQALIGSSDDGEPGGTAGRPMLAVLEGSGLCEVVVVGTRYYGGVKLGTGGLVRAYGGAARAALANLRTVERLLHYLATITTDYALYGHLRYLLPQDGVRILDERFAEGVTLDLAVPADGAAALADRLRELSSGAIDVAGRWAGWRYLDVTE